MDKALCTIDNREWDARLFSKLDPNEIQLKRRNLICLGCQGDAWFRKSSYGNESPHFCAHHQEGCSFGTAYEAIGEGDNERKIPAVDADNGIIIDFGLPKSYSVDVASGSSESESGSSGLKLATGNTEDGGKKYPSHTTLKQMLYRLVKSDGHYYEDKNLIITDDTLHDLPKSGSELFVHFNDVREWLDGARRIFWGFISDAGQTSDGKIWLNAGNIRKGLSVCLMERVTESFREQFRIGDNLDELDGCHALIVGTCTYAMSGKPVIRCNDLNYIVLRRYKAD
ncbi:TPA: hypothetical protein ACJI8U_001240 [Morganella morganii]